MDRLELDGAVHGRAGDGAGDREVGAAADLRAGGDVTHAEDAVIAEVGRPPALTMRSSAGSASKLTLPLANRSPVGDRDLGGEQRADAAVVTEGQALELEAVAGHAELGLGVAELALADLQARHVEGAAGGELRQRDGLAGVVADVDVDVGAALDEVGAGGAREVEVLEVGVDADLRVVGEDVDVGVEVADAAEQADPRGAQREHARSIHRRTSAMSVRANLPLPTSDTRSEPLVPLGRATGPDRVRPAVRRSNHGR